MKSNYIKVIKVILLCFLLISVVVALYAAIKGFNDLSVDLLFYWTYAMIAVAVLAIVFVAGAIGIKNDKKFLWKLLAIAGGTVVVCAAVYFLSPGAPAVGLAQQPSDITLKLTDTVLNLTYLISAAAILAVVVGEVCKAIRNKRDTRS